MQQIGTDPAFPDDCKLLGDKIYPNRGPVVTAISAQQIARRRGRDRQKCLKFNRLIRKYRVYVEHAIGELKVYKAVGSLWRHPREMLPLFVCTCAGLVCRRKELGLIF